MFKQNPWLQIAMDRFLTPFIEALLCQVVPDATMERRDLQAHC